MNNAKWIGLKKGEDFPIKFEEYTKEKVQELKGKVNVDKRSLLFRKKFVVNGGVFGCCEYNQTITLGEKDGKPLRYEDLCCEVEGWDKMCFEHNVDIER